jgi:predicted nucleic acid-binding protein
MIVPDASVIADLLLNTNGATRIRARIFDAGETLHAPGVLDLEVAQVLRRHAARRAISPHRGRWSIALLRLFPITRYPHEMLLGRIWQLRDNLTAYDAAYVALAEGLNAILLTRDSRIARATGHKAQIEVI